ncbi:MAG: T9SS type A sorting domain-containing protein [Bacteroidota bacterium]|nr:MAG: T9SS type A sorting domain-containing protein [Bacteroidota bacterium]
MGCRWNLYLSGRIIWNADIDPDTSSNGLHTLSNTNNNFNSFIMKLGNATNPTSINPASENAQDIRLYPNPATTYCILESFQSKIRTMAIFSYSGQCVLHSPVDATSIRINTAHLPKGNFILRYETSDQIEHSIPLQIR